MTKLPNPLLCPNEPNSDSPQTFNEFGDLCLPTQLGKDWKASTDSGVLKGHMGLPWGGDWAWEDRTEQVPEGLWKEFYHLLFFFFFFN